MYNKILACNVQDAKNGESNIKKMIMYKTSMGTLCCSVQRLGV